MSPITFGAVLLSIAFAGDAPLDSSVDAGGDSRPASRPAARKFSLWPWSRRNTDAASDSVLLARCKNLVFSEDELRLSPIEVNVDRGTAYLAGTVASPALSRRAEQLARRTPDLKDVVNRLRISVSTANSDRFGVVKLSSPTLVPRAPSGDPANAYAKTDEAFPPLRSAAANRLTNGAVLVGRPRWVEVAPDLPRVVTYTVRRPIAPAGDAQTASVVRPAPDSVRAPESTAKSPSSKFASLIRPKARPKVFEELPAPESKPDRTERLTAVDRLLQADPRAVKLQYRMLGRELTLSGEVESFQDLSEIIAKIGELPGVGLVAWDRNQMRIVD
jgi:hypothetical protein